MSNYFTLNSLHSLKDKTVEHIIRAFTNINDKDLLGELAFNYNDLLSIWADDNGISVDSLFSYIENALNSICEFSILKDCDIPMTELNINGIILNMSWDIEPDA